MRWLLILLLAGCASIPSAPFTTQTQYGPVTEYPGSAGPCANIKAPTTGCYAYMRNGHHIWYFTTRSRPHEMAHVAGMRHTDWKMYSGWACATVTVAGDTEYKAGDRLCVSPSGGEWKN